MNLILVYDCETQGLPLWDKPSEDPGQPHIVQLAALLVNPDPRPTDISANIVQSLSVIIRPDGWEVPAEVTEIHGITTEYALQVGVPEKLALEMFLELWRGRKRIGHVQSFDARIIRIATKRYCDETVINAWKEGPAECTAELAKPIMQMPAKTKGKFKTPKLTEAYQHFFQKELKDAHSALGDTMACMELYFELKRRNEAAVKNLIGDATAQ